IAVPLFGFFALVDLTFLSANLLKIAEGGWFPIVVAALVFALMGTWWRGRRLLAAQRARDAMPLDLFVDTLNPERPVRVPGTSVFIGREKLRSRSRRMVFWRWRDRLFIFLTNLALDATEFFRIPPNRVVELGGQIEI